MLRRLLWLQYCSIADGESVPVPVPVEGLQQSQSESVTKPSTTPESSKPGSESEPVQVSSGQIQSQSKPSTTPGTTPGTNKPKRMKNWQSRWQSEFDWLRYDGSKMYCSVCEKASNARKSLRSNAFVIGSQNFQHSSLIRHQLCDDHRSATSRSSVETIQNRMAIECYSVSCNRPEVVRKAAENFSNNA
jgi:hypothetical protein